MKLVENIRKKLFAKVLFGIPNSHLVAVTGLSLCLGLVSALPSKEAAAARSVGTLSLPEANEAELEPEVLPEPLPAVSLRTVKLSVKSGDNLSLLFKRAGLSDTAMMNFIAAADQSKKLESIKPKHDLIFELDEDNKIHRLTYIINRLSHYSFNLNAEDGSYAYEEVTRTPDISRAARSGVIKSSLYLAGQAAGMDDKLIMELAEIFGWDIDFALDIRSGDSFKVLYEEKFLDGEKLGNGAILSAEFTNQKQTFQAVRYVHSDGRVEYYTPEGKNMRKAFLRAPVDFRRISSNFNPKRLHPVTKVVKPHRGIDYAARTGTPVWSSGDGKVIASSYNKYNGHYVVIQHGNNIQTKYLHLHKRKVKKGERVRQKQIIGTVGSTGMSTGPHLHYEFLLNGVHRNPKTIVQKLPKAESISPELRDDFSRQTSTLIAELMQETSTGYASSNSALPPSS